MLFIMKKEIKITKKLKMKRKKLKIKINEKLKMI